MLALDPSPDQIPSLVSNGYEDSLPPLVDSDDNYENGEAPLVLLDNEVSNNRDFVSKTAQEVTTTTRHTVSAALKTAGVPPASWQRCDHIIPV